MPSETRLSSTHGSTEERPQAIGNNVGSLRSWFQIQNLWFIFFGIAISVQKVQKDHDPIPYHHFTPVFNSQKVVCNKHPLSGCLVGGKTPPRPTLVRCMSSPIRSPLQVSDFILFTLFIFCSVSDCSSLPLLGTWGQKETSNLSGLICLLVFLVRSPWCFFLELGWMYFGLCLCGDGCGAAEWKVISGRHCFLFRQFWRAIVQLGAFVQKDSYFRLPLWLRIQGRAYQRNWSMAGGDWVRICLSRNLVFLNHRMQVHHVPPDAKGRAETILFEHLLGAERYRNLFKSFKKRIPNHLFCVYRNSSGKEWRQQADKWCGGSDVCVIFHCEFSKSRSPLINQIKSFMSILVYPGLKAPSVYSHIASQRPEHDEAYSKLGPKLEPEQVESDYCF